MNVFLAELERQAIRGVRAGVAPIYCHARLLAKSVTLVTREDYKGKLPVLASEEFRKDGLVFYQCNISRIGFVEACSQHPDFRLSNV